MKQKLIDSIKRRLNEEVNNRSSIKFLKEYEVEDYLDNVISVVYLYTRMKRGSKKYTILMIEVI